MGRLEGKCALVIGAGSVGEGWGNGRATCAVASSAPAVIAAVIASESESVSGSTTALVIVSFRTPLPICSSALPRSSSSSWPSSALSMIWSSAPPTSRWSTGS